MYFFESVRDDLDRYAAATAQKNINLDVLSKLLVPIPPAAELKRICEEAEKQLSAISVQKQFVEKNLLRTARLRQSILHEAFLGRLSA